MKCPGRVAATLIVLGCGSAVAAEYIPPPQMPAPNTWQGRSQGVVRVLDKLDAHVETLTLKPGETVHYKSLDVTLRSCLDHPPGVPHDSAAFVEVQDKRADVQPLQTWMLASEPSVGVFESPVYGVQLLSCQGDLVAPLAPPLPPVPPPPDAYAPPPDAAASDATMPTTPGTVPPPASGDGEDQGAEPDLPDAPAGGPPPASTSVDPGSSASPGASPPGSAAPADAQPDPVYPAGPPG